MRPSALPSIGRARGFTLVELVIVVTILAIGAALALPSLREVLVAQRVRASATDMMSSLLLARSEAIKRGEQVSVTPLGATWTSGWQVKGVVEGDSLERKDVLGDGVEVTRAPDSVVYDRNGRLAVPAVVRFEIAAATTTTQTRCITVEPGGLPRLADGSCG